MSLRIAMVGGCPFPAPYGSQVLIRETADALQQRGLGIHLVVYGNRSGLDDPGIPVHRGLGAFHRIKLAPGPSFLKPFLDVALGAALRRVLRLHRIDVVHAHNYEALLVALAVGHRPIVYHAHNAMADELPHYFRGSALARAFGRWLDRTFPKHADHVITLHTRLRDYLIACGCDPAKVSVVPPPMDPKHFTPESLSNERPCVLYTGNLDPYQNLPFLLRAMKRVRAVLPDAPFVIATPEHRVVPGAEMARTPDFASLRTILTHDAVVACPRVSWSGYPMKLLNAMAAGKPCVACASSAHPLTHGRDGWVVEDNDEAQFAYALVELLSQPNLRKTLGDNARASLLANHNPQQAGALIERIYQTVAPCYHQSMAYEERT
jgi:glycosyltransferase involved in cell wall biosynthesis